jgi:hypothetical protein
VLYILGFISRNISDMNKKESSLAINKKGKKLRKIGKKRNDSVHCSVMLYSMQLEYVASVLC